MNNLIYTNNDYRYFSSQSSCKSQKNKFDFKTLKTNTCNSLNEVECFLNDFHRFYNYIKLYKILK